MPKKSIRKQNASAGQRILAPDSNQKSTNHTHPAFCFKFCQKGFTVQDCDTDSKASLADKLYQLSNINWNTIQKSPRHGLGHEIIDQKSIQTALPPNTPEDRNFLAFRLGGSKNSVFIGYRNGKIFYIVWVDKNGAIYKH